MAVPMMNLDLGHRYPLRLRKNGAYDKWEK
jgi:hypothetical protein